ncbi:ABC transporter ATP-binding protein [Deminuibacter soli]|uniref:ABC transporter ATP-binding protein n=1 Tax=Deminuibacter soli TaxID=2291815 RepID=A0A3E1NL90_9BACT|nr:ABC transporter ATP-binding protein [Deminuibacter soli]RFM28661.1 ABC transporter ATP-binding protein [Deminuibacter soli]
MTAYAPLLRVENLSIGFTNNGRLSPTLQNVSFSIGRGELVAVVGESGSGKSITALSVLRLLSSPPAVYSNGHIYFHHNNGEPADLLQYTQQQMEALRGNRISMIFQEPMSSLNPVHTCGNQVMEALQQHHRLSNEAARDKTLDLFNQVQLPTPERIFNSYPHQLSGGQKQRVMIAMAMCTEPALLICDEPTTALDVTVQKNILQLIRQLQQHQNMGVLFITHDLAVVSEIADSIVVLYKGKIVEQGPARQLLQNPQHPYTRALLACRPALHPKGERLPVVADFLTVTSDGELVEKTNTPPLHPAVAAVEAAPAAHNTPLVSVKNLNVWFPVSKNWLGKPLQYTKAVNDVSFDVMVGETLGLVGESGCGKTTLGRALLRLVQPTSGEIYFKGRDMVQMPPNELKALRKDVQIIFQDPFSSLNPRITIGDAIAEPLKVHGIGKNDAERKERVMDLLRKVNLLPEHYNRYPHAFSGGQRQRIVIARALALEPSFVICDESVSALDVSVQAQVLNLLNDLKQAFGFTAIFISHDLAVVKYISDRIMVMNKGRIEEIGDAAQIYHHPQSSYTQRLIEAIPQIRL